MSGRRRSKRATARVDYTKFAGDDGEDGIAGKSAPKDDDDSEEFKEDEEKDAASEEDAMELDEEEAAEEEDEEIEEVVKTPKPKKAVASKASSAKKLFIPRGRPAKAVDSPKTPSRRSGSLVERMGLILGSNKHDQAESINARATWGNSMFIPQKSDMGKFMRVPTFDVQEFPVDRQVLETATEEELKDYLLPPRSVKVNETDLPSFTDMAGYENDIFNGTILNAGGFVTSVSWAPGFTGYDQYLAVGMHDDNHRDPMDCQVNSIETSLYSSKGFPSSVYIYHVNLDPEAAGAGSICTLVSSFSHDYGSVVELKWRPGGSVNENSIGLLAMITQDGYLRVLHVPQDTELTRYKIVTPLRCFETPGYKITAFCWRTETCLSAGTDNGSIAEFDISDFSSQGHEPSFMVSVAASHITTMSSGFPTEPHLLFEFSSDGIACILDVRNLRSRNYSLRMKGCSTVSDFIPWASSFVCMDDIFTARAQPMRDFRSQGTMNSFTSHSVAVTALSASRFHPFVLSGSVDGLVKIGNTIRRLLVPKRPLSSTYLSLTLWGLDYSMVEKAYRVVSIYKTEKIGKGDAIELLQPHPPNAFVTSLEWSPAVEMAEWYVAGTSSGLIRIHRLVDAATKV